MDGEFGLEAEDVAEVQTQVEEVRDAFETPRN